MGFVKATESALRPRAYFSLQALAHFLERVVRLDRKVSYAPPGLACLALSALSLDSQVKLCRILDSFLSRHSGSSTKRFSD